MNAKSMYREDYRAMLRRRRRQTIQRKRSLEATKMIMVYDRIFYIIGLICISLALAATAVCVFMRGYYQSQLAEKDREISELKLENEMLSDQIGNFSDTYNKTASLLQEVSSMAYELDQENDTLVMQANSLQETINQYEEREELFDKYEWAIIRSDNTRTDITYDRITSLEELAGEKGLSDDSVDLVLALSMTESQGTETAANPNSSARGFGQMLEATARYTYETLMGNGEGSYNHDMAFDGDTNMEMMCYYLDYLGVKYDDDVDLVLKEYRGSDDSSYIAKLDKYLAKAGTNIHSIELRP